MASENLIPIPGRLHSVATEGHVTGADEIYDDDLQKTQDVINAEIDEVIDDVALIDTTESSPAVVPGFDPQTDTVHVTAQTLSESQKAQVRNNIGLGDVDAKISQAVASEASQRAASDSSLQSSISAEATARANAVSAEASRAQAAESALQNNIEALTQSNIVVVADHTSVSNPDPLTIYREQGTNTYSDWMYQNGSWMKMAEFDNAIDDVPTAGSANLVKSGGIRRIENDIIQSIIDCPYYDSSKYIALSNSSHAYEDNKILKDDGTTATQQNFRIYTITHSSYSVYWRTIGVVGNFTGESSLSLGYANVELKDNNGNLVFRGLLQGYKMIVLQQNWVLRLCLYTDDLAGYFVQNAQAIPQIIPPVKSVDAWPLNGSNNPTKGDGIFNYSKLLEQSIIDSPYIDKTKFIPVTEASTDISYEDNMLLKNDGTTISNNAFGIYTITFTNSSAYNRTKGIYAFFSGLSGLGDGYANIELKDNSGNLIFRERLNGEKLIIMQPSWVLKLCVVKTEASMYLVQNTQGFQLENLNNFITNAGNALNKKIYGIGDSLTYEGTYLTELSTLTGIATKNLGVGGEDVPTILGRVNSLPYKVASDIIIPASNASEVEFSITSDYGVVLPLRGNNNCRVQIAGIIGTLRTEAGSWATSATYFFKRENSGDAVSVKAGEPMYCVGYGAGYQSRFGSVPSSQYQIIWMGQNGGFYVSDGTSITQDDADNLVSIIRGHIERTQPQNFIVVSPPKNTNTILEDTLSKAFGGSFLNVRKQLVDNGIRVALDNGYLVGEYPTAQDTQDIQNGIIPTSLRADDVHLNVAGYKTFARLCYENIIKYVWML